jgi:hypothetical protein
MIEIDLMYSSYNRRKNYAIAVYAFFFSAQRSDEILEVGAIYPGFDFSLN